jgi:hypothetical protein
MLFLTSLNPIRVVVFGFSSLVCAIFFLVVLFGFFIPGLTKEQEQHKVVSNISELTDTTKYPNGSYVSIKARINPEMAIAFEEEGETKYHYVVKLQENEKVAVYFDKNDTENINTIETDSSREDISEIPEREYIGRIFARSASIIYIDIEGKEIDFEDGSTIDRVIEVGSKPADKNDTVILSALGMLVFFVVGIANFYAAFRAWKG